MYGHVDQTFQQSITVVKMILYVHASLVTPQLCFFVSFSPPFRHDLRNSKGVFQCFSINFTQKSDQSDVINVMIHDHLCGGKQHVKSGTKR